MSGGAGRQRTECQEHDRERHEAHGEDRELAHARCQSSGREAAATWGGGAWHEVREADGLRLFRRRRAARCGRCRGRRLRGRSRRARPHSMRRLWFLAHAPERGGRCRPGGCGRLGRRWSRLLRSGRGRWCRGRRRRRSGRSGRRRGGGCRWRGRRGRGGRCRRWWWRGQCHSRDGHRDRQRRQRDRRQRDPGASQRGASPETAEPAGEEREKAHYIW